MLKKIYRLSDEGNRAIFHAGIWMSLFQLMTMCPVILLAFATEEMLAYFTENSVEKISLWEYLLAGILILGGIYFTYKKTYHSKYIVSGQEDNRMRMNLADKIRRLPLSYIGQRDLTDLTATIMDDVATVENALATSVIEFMSSIISSLIVLFPLFFYDARLTLVLAACIPIAAVVMGFCKKISEGTNKRNKKNKLIISDGLQEYLENIKVLRASNEMEAYQKTLEKKMKKIIPGLVLYEFLSGTTISVAYNVMRFGLGFVIIAGSSYLMEGAITPAKFIVFLYVAVRVFEPLSSACEKLGALIFSLVSAKRIRDLMDYQEQDGLKEKEVEKYDITFNDVSFRYQEEEVLHNISFMAKQGEITALVGPSGCGKSTICKIAARFWDVSKGEIHLGNTNINTILPETLLENYSMVFQDVVLFNDTIYNNIRIGKKDATREEVIAAAKMARCEEFIEKLPLGYETVIGENGRTLSGGERQRISIARAFLKDAPIILLDESTASIDPENETKIQEAIGKLIQKKQF